eukprot:7555921-Heterocapsa_arctica.AAC.1
MTEWIKRMRKDKVWMEAATDNKFFMVCARLPSSAMRKEGRHLAVRSSTDDEGRDKGDDQDQSE